MKEKRGKNTETNSTSHSFEFVNGRVLSLLLGRSQNTFPKDKDLELFNKIGFVYRGNVRRYSFTDAAKLAYPELTNYEIARLRVDINERILEGRKRNKAGKSRSEDE